MRSYLACYLFLFIVLIFLFLLCSRLWHGRQLGREANSSARRGRGESRNQNPLLVSRASPIGRRVNRRPILIPWSPMLRRLI